jgi:hypothetical protein
VLVSGLLANLGANDGVLTFSRTDDNECFRILANFADGERRIDVGKGAIAASTGLHPEGDLVSGEMHLASGEALVVKIAG